MKSGKKLFLTVIVFICFFLLTAPQALAANDRFDANKMGDMSDFDPGNPIIPTGDTIKIAIVCSFSGPAALVGDIYFASVQSVAHDINKRGGILVDGKKKLVQVIKANHESKVPITKKVCERMVLQEKVDVLWGTNGSHLMKVINQVAKKYKVIAQCTAALSDELYDATNFTRYSFMTSFSCDQIGRAAAYYYGQIRKKEKKFYILCQDYLFGHSMAHGFKRGLKEYYPEAVIVGEDYHKLFATDYAPYISKIKASGAEAIYTGDWIPDAANLLKQSRQTGLKLPFINTFLDEPNMLHEVGVEGTKGLVHVAQFGSEPPAFKTPEQLKYYLAWRYQFDKWKKPFNTKLFMHGTGNMGSYRMQTYWLLSVIERAGSTDPEKIIKVWEGDTYEDVNGTVYEMRACDHKVAHDLFVEIYVEPEKQKNTYNIPPYYWYKGCSEPGPVYRIPAEKVLPLMDTKLERCK
ncbi:MAG: ABC transporter substrate-binding protein [Deltaproteobacteria bacterium]|nr:ABC transporter substrate-binding protein [Deltaproteobacteria bacterium]